MSNAFHTDNGWRLPRALAFLCCGVRSTKDRDVITDWLVDPAVLPAEYKKHRHALAATFAAFDHTWPNFSRSKTLHPVIWIWFGIDLVRSHLHPDCMSHFVAYIEDNLNIGYRPILRRHVGPVPDTFSGALFSTDKEVVRALPVSTLPYRPFDRNVANRNWRSDLQRNDMPRPRLNPRSPGTSKRSAESPNCIATLSSLLEEMAEKHQNVERLPKASGSRQFRSLGLKRQQLIDSLLAGRGRASLKEFRPSTLLRAMSAVVECKPGPVESGLKTVACK